MKNFARLSAEIFKPRRRPERKPLTAPPRGTQFHALEDKTSGASYWIALSEPSTIYDQWVKALKGPDDNAKLIMTLLQGGGCLVDVGAHIGTIAIPAAMRGSTVVAIEMNGDNCNRLRAGATANDLANLHVVETAASDFDGMVHVAGIDAWGHVTVDPDDRLSTCMTLDTVLPRFLPPSAVGLVFKIDVEGHELQVFRGATRSIEMMQPTILFESIDVEGQAPTEALGAREFLSRAGYSLYLVRGAILSPKAPTDIHEGLVCDYLAIPKGHERRLAGTGLKVRPLRVSERLDWIKEMLESEALHQRHAAGVILRWQREEPQMVLRARAIIQSLIGMDHLHDLRGDLQRLL